MLVTTASTYGEIDDSTNTTNVIGEGDDTVSAAVAANDFMLTSTSGNNYITLGDVGAGGNQIANSTNEITLGTGADTVVMTTLDNTVVKMAAGADSVKITGAIAGAGEETVYGGDGTDSLNLTNDAAVGDAAFANFSSFEVIEYGATTDGRTLTIGANAQSTGIRTVAVNSAAGNAEVVATAYTEALTLTATANGSVDMSGGSANDTMTGGDGNNVLTVGDDSMTGGAGTGTSPQTVLQLRPLPLLTL